MGNTRPNYVKLGKDGKEMYMPNMMALKYTIVKKINSSTALNDKFNEEKDEEKKKKLKMESASLIFEIIDDLTAGYPEYAEFSETFSLIDHVKVLTSISKGIKAVDLESMIQGDFIIDEPDDKDMIASEEPSDFLSENH